MELDELQTIWQNMSTELEQQKKLTNTLIMEMTQQKYKNKFSKLKTYETIGGVICFAAAIYLIFNFGKLDTWYLSLSGIFAIAFLVILPILTLGTLNSISGLKLQEKNYSETIISYQKQKKRLLIIQQAGIFCSFLFMLVSLPVASKILKDKDLFVDGQNLLWYIPIMTIFLLFFARWGYGCYKSITTSAENLLTELE
ncbi:MAG: hypothetical protein KJO73_12695 [Croceitalea sp.]|nr:hypothetical protein [Croceitalea sp.]